MTRSLSSALSPLSRVAWRHSATPHASSGRQLFATVSASSKGLEQDAQVREWLVIIPDNEGVLERRIQIRPKHSENFRRLHREGYVSWAGPVFSQPCHRKTGTEERPFMGSVMVVRDVSRENIYKRLSTDLFITEGIWNWEKAKVLPFNTVMRQPPVTASTIDPLVASKEASKVSV